MFLVQLIRVIKGTPETANKQRHLALCAERDFSPASVTKITHPGIGTATPKNGFWWFSGIRIGKCKTKLTIKRSNICFYIKKNLFRLLFQGSFKVFYQSCNLKFDKKLSGSIVKVWKTSVNLVTDIWAQNKLSTLLISEHSEHLIFADCWTIFIQYGYLVEYFCPGLLQASKGRLLSEVDTKKKKETSRSRKSRHWKQTAKTRTMFWDASVKVSQSSIYIGIWLRNVHSYLGTYRSNHGCRM